MRNSPKKHPDKINPGSVAFWKRIRCLFPRKGTMQLFTGEKKNSVEGFLSKLKTARETQASLPPPTVVFETRHCAGVGMVWGRGSASHTFAPNKENLMGTSAREVQAENLHSRPELLKRELLFNLCVRSLTSPRGSSTVHTVELPHVVSAKFQLRTRGVFHYRNTSAGHQH